MAIKKATPRQLSEDEVRRHIEGFAKSFIVASRRQRCLGLLREGGQKLSQDMHKFENYLDPRYCQPLAARQSIAGDAVGVYVDDVGGTRRASFEEAETLHLSCRDGIFSLVPGELAIFFHHDDGPWLCRKASNAGK
ncbi:MAG: hypothetical protein WBD40_17090 [Tepidisphaeraceae bacterium]